MNFSRASIPDLAVLQAFEASARHGNFTKAAAELNLTQSAISRQIQTLENQLGVTLFERVRKRVYLSMTGQLILSDVRRLMVQSEELVVRARAASEGSSILSVATLPTFGSRWLMKRLPDFLDAHPGTVVEVASRSAPFDLQAEGVDLAIHYGQPVWANATCNYLCSEIILPVATPAMLNASAITEPKHVSRAPLLHLTTRPRSWAEWFHLNGLDHETAYRGSRFDQFSMIIEAALCGMGVALLPTYLIENQLASGELTIAFQLPLATKNSYYVVIPEGGQGNGSATAFQSWLLAMVGKSI